MNQDPEHMNERSKLLPRSARQWLEIFVALTALCVSVVSVWVAIGTEDANRKMVAASSWPHIQLDSSNSGAQGQPYISLILTNSGVGPAKVETFELLWKGKAYATSHDFLLACCDFHPAAWHPESNAPQPTVPTTSNASGMVVRAGASWQILGLRLGPDDVKAWHALDKARFEATYRACYCSVFDECWIADLASANSLRPKSVKKCPTPKVPYSE